LTPEEKDKIEGKNLLDLLEHEIIPTYYKSPAKWTKIMKASMKDVLPFFDAGRMAKEYYDEMYLK
jgi:starch phosphorylase